MPLTTCSNFWSATAGEVRQRIVAGPFQLNYSTLFYSIQKTLAAYSPELPIAGISLLWCHKGTDVCNILRIKIYPITSQNNDDRLLHNWYMETYRQKFINGLGGCGYNADSTHIF